MSNAVGSNVFDILLCLGLPWFLKTTIVTPNQAVIVYSAGRETGSQEVKDHVNITLFCAVGTHCWVNGGKL